MSAGRLAPRSVLRVADWAWPGHPQRWADVPRRLVPTVVGTLRLTAATVIAFGLSTWVTRGRVDLTGALTALLVVQATSFQTMRMAGVRVGAVVLGVLIAVGLTTWVGLTWWSLAIAVGAALVAAKILRLGEQALEAPISAMLILSVHGSDIAVQTRIVTTLVGALVGVLFMVAFPPALPTRSAASSVSRIAWYIARSLQRAASSLRREPVTRSQVTRWAEPIEESRTAIRDASRLVDDVRDARMLNPRALGSGSAEPVLRAGLQTLERTALAVRSLYAVVQTEAPAEAGTDDGYGEEIRRAFAVVTGTMADAVSLYGSLIEAEVDGREEEAEEALHESLDALREARAILTELMFVDARSEPNLWLLRGSVLSAVEHVIQRLDVEQRARERAHLRRPARLPLRRADLWRAAGDLERRIPRLRTRPGSGGRRRGRAWPARRGGARPDAPE